VFIVTVFKDERGREPVLEFLAKLTREERARFQSIIELVRSNGTNIRGDLGHWVEEFFQVRFKECRCLMYKPDKNTFVLLHAFKKKSDKTPEREIKQARTNRKKDQMQRLSAAQKQKK